LVPFTGSGHVPLADIQSADLRNYRPSFLNPRESPPNAISARAKTDPLTKGVMVPVNRRTASTTQVPRKKTPAILLFIPMVIYKEKREKKAEACRRSLHRTCIHAAVPGTGANPALQGIAEGFRTDKLSAMMLTRQNQKAPAGSRLGPSESKADAWSNMLGASPTTICPVPSLKTVAGCSFQRPLFSLSRFCCCP
jgi:hypothetical protein